MENANLWLLTRGQLSVTQSRHIDGAIEQSYRKQDSNFIQEMGMLLIAGTVQIYLYWGKYGSYSQTRHLSREARSKKTPTCPVKRESQERLQNSRIFLMA
ncbi:hypothetical protein TNIN_424781 [Trichonephila inaurata madagascariensis]|uniref:Uncharacterized protein n=1 Tax=Trichonephila inaurata madagascariensis TaxID=2747483 RepID=A0A8X7BMC3_9ARAC|nr:hypothetical protein TNIN_424781 [Trichonephila inaurata madagascariensis]